jgi:hypothetical protein
MDTGPEFSKTTAFRIFVYGSKTWILLTQQLRVDQIETSEMAMLRPLARLTLHDCGNARGIRLWLNIESV